MNHIDFFNYSKEDFDRIWTRRSQLPKTWKGGNPKPAFNYNVTNTKDSYFLKSNWNDPAIADFRKILYDIDINETKEIGKARIQRLCPDYDESRYIILNDYDVYVLSQYKSRGNIQSFISTEYGNPIHICEFTQLLIDLGLEKLEEQKEG